VRSQEQENEPQAVLSFISIIIELTVQEYLRNNFPGI